MLAASLTTEPHILTIAIIVVTATAALLFSFLRVRALKNTLRAKAEQEHFYKKLNRKLIHDLREYRLKETRHRETHDIVHQILDTLPEFVCIKDAGGVYLACNNAFADFVGKPADEILGSKSGSLYPKDIAEMLDIQNSEVVEKKKQTRTEQWFTHPDGSRRYLEIVRTPLFDAEGNVVSINSVGRDITDRKRGEDKLLVDKAELQALVNEHTLDLKREIEERRDAEKALRTIFNNTHDAIFIHSLDGKIIDVNNRVLELFEVNREAAMQYRLTGDFSGPGNQIDGILNLRDRVAKGEKFVFDWMARKPGSGELISVEVAMTSFKQGGETVLLTNVHDITQRKQVEQSQRDYLEFLNTLFEGIGTAILIFDAAGNIFYDCNTMAEELLGMRKDEIIQNKPKDILLTMQDKSTINLLSPSPDDVGVHEEGILKPRKRERRTLSRQLFMMRIGTERRLVQVLFDITDRKNLERRVINAQKLESIGLLAAGMAHEINTPIQYIGDSVQFLINSYDSVLALLDRLKQLAEDCKTADCAAPHVEAIESIMQQRDMAFILGEIPEACDRAISGVQRAAAVVQGMRNFSHPGSREMKSVSLNQALQNTLSVTRSEWKHVAEIETDFDPNLPLVKCFANSINQALLNLIVNAAHAIREKVEGTEEKGTLAISTKHNAHNAIIRIRDTGAGIRPDVLDKIFDPFFTTKDVGKGTGQGLTIVYDIIVGMHGGFIDVQSTPGKGATFVVTLPLTPKE